MSTAMYNAHNGYEGVMKIVAALFKIKYVPPHTFFLNGFLLTKV